MAQILKAWSSSGCADPAMLLAAGPAAFFLGAPATAMLEVARDGECLPLRGDCPGARLPLRVRPRKGYGLPAGYHVS
jgi:hypothetical protein